VTWLETEFIGEEYDRCALFKVFGEIVDDRLDNIFNLLFLYQNLAMSYHVSEQLKERCLSFLDESLVNIEKCSQAFSIRDAEALILKYARAEDAIIATTMNLNKILEENQDTYMKLKDVIETTKINQL